MPTNSPVLSAALEYIARGWAPIPVPFREKGPRLPGWTHMRLRADTAPAYFNGQAQNIGVILGEASRWLVDVDLDCDEAVSIAPSLLPATATFGRRSKPHSHWLYYAPECESAKFALRLADGSTKTLVELRSTNLQTVFPPSTHPGGESVAWIEDISPTPMDAEALRDIVAELATRCATARYPEGMPPEVAAQVAAWAGAPDVAEPPPKVAPVARAYVSVAEAVRRYNADHATEYPRANGDCPACGHKDCFGRLPDAPDRWACFAAGHDRVGLRGEKCWHGDQLDLDAHARGLERKALLRESGYLISQQRDYGEAVVVPKSSLAWTGVGEDAPLASADEPPPTDEPPEEIHQRPPITYRKGDGHLAVRAAMPILADACSIYRRGGRLVSIAVVPPITEGTRRTLAAAPAIIALSRARCWEMLSAAIEWRKFDGRSNDVVACDPPASVVENIHQRGDWPDIPELHGLATTPILREDGSLCITPGYDVDTGLYYAPRGRVPDMPVRPTLDDARNAIAELAETVCDFPFASPVHRSVWLSTVLSRVGWHAFVGGAPLTMIDATTPGSGKSLLADVSSLISTGSPCPRSPWVREDDEFRKRVLAHLMAGDQVALIDNVPGGQIVGWPSFDAMLTSAIWTDRELGKSANATVPMDTLWMITGNNITVGGDTGRRTIQVRLDCEVERPEERNGFRHEPLLSWVAYERQRLLGAAITMLRAFILAGKPDPGLTPFGSFEGWSSLIRAALVWVGEADPADAKMSLQESTDEHGAAHTRLLADFRLLGPQDRGLTTAEIIDELEHDATGILRGIKDAVAVICPVRDREGYNRRSFGRALRSLVGRVRSVDGAQMRLMLNGKDHNGIIRWRVDVLLDGRWQTQQTQRTGSTQ